MTCALRFASVMSGSFLIVHPDPISSKSILIRVLEGGPPPLRALNLVMSSGVASSIIFVSYRCWDSGIGFG